MVLFVEIKAMNIKQWIALLMLYVGYLLLGAIVFYYLERGQEIVKRNEDFQLYKDLLGYCGRPLTENADIDDVSQEYWNFYKSVFFVLTVVSTVGYGNIHPTMPLTRYLMMIYAVIGLPINGILLTSLASFFSTVFIRAHKKYKRYESRFGLTVDVLTYLIPGILFFIFVPATAFYYFEEWTYEESVYFAFVTLTTIGFGDLVAGQKNYKKFNPELVMIYKTLLLGWIIFGLGYLIMLLGYLTRAMRSKKVVKLEQKLVEALTHSKIWNGFAKDIGYLRRIMNELYLDKFKPVFRDEHLRFHRKHTYRRSKSLPNITFGVDDETIFDESQMANRKRAHSEFIPCREGLTRVFSESDLHRIDRHATFASATTIRPSELLRQVVGAMEDSMRRQEDSLGINVFSDDEILQSEGWYNRKENSFATLYHPPSYEDIVNAKRRKERALSEIPGPRSNPQTITASSNFGGWEWTWSGAQANKIYDIVNERHQANLLQKNSKNRSPNLSASFLGGAKWLNPLRKKRRFYSESQDFSGSKLSIGQPENKFLESVKKSDKLSFEDLRKTSLHEPGLPKYRPDMSYMTHTAGTGAQGIGLMHGRVELSRPDRMSSVNHHPNQFLSKGNQRLLNETSLGDFLRALTALHNRVGRQQIPDEFWSRWNISSNPSSPPQSHSLIDLSPTKEAPPKHMLSTKPSLNRTESMPISNEITEKEPSNLKRLGRFLLRSYSPKSESNPDVSLTQTDKMQKKMSVDQAETTLAPDGSGIRIQIETPSPKSSSEDDFFTGVGIVRSNTIDSSMRLRSSPAMNPFRSAGSTDSVYPQSERSVPARQTSLRWRPGGPKSQGETCSSKPGLSNVKEVIN